jgi:DNA polymerase-3 subunit epsilon
MALFWKNKSDFPDFWKNYENTFSEKSSTDINGTRFVVLDTETTGFNYNKDRILSIGALPLINGRIVVKACFEVNVRQSYYDKNSARVHGILKSTRQLCIPEREAVIQLLKYAGNSVIVGHHTGFDITMINRALARNNLPNLKNDVLDTAILYRKTLIASPLLPKKKHYSLDDLADQFNIIKKDRHTALGDAYITAIAFMQILARHRKKEKLTLRGLLKIR